MTGDRWRWINFALFALLIAVVLFAPRLPFQDYPNWVYQGQVYERLLIGDPQASAFALRGVVVPNSVVTVVLGCLDIILPPDFSGRLLAAFTILLTFFGMRRLFSADGENRAAEPLALMLSAHLFLFYGFLSFSLGLGLVLVLLTTIGRGETAATRTVEWIFAFLLLYFTHFLALVFLAGYALARGVIFGDRRRFSPWVVLPALVVPAALFFLYVRNAPLGAGSIWSYSPMFKAGLLFKAPAVLYLFNDSRNLPSEAAVVAAGGLVWLGLIALVLRLGAGRWRAVRREPMFLIALLVFMVGVALPYKLAGVYYLESRFYYFAVVLAVAALLRGHRGLGKKTVVALTAAAALVLIGKSAMIAGQGYSEAKFERRLEGVVSEVPSYNPVMLGFDLPEYYPGATGMSAVLGRLSPNINCRNQVPLYDMARREIVYPGMFATGLLECRLATCDPRAYIQGNEPPYTGPCRTALFISPPGFTGQFLQLLRQHMNVVVEQNQLILAETPAEEE